MHDIVNPACKGLYGAGCGAGGGVADATTPGTILLVSNAHDSGSCLVESVERFSVGNDVIVRIIENDVASPELLCASPLPLTMTGVFADVE